MTKEAIIAEIKKLSPEEQREIAAALWETAEEDYELTDEGKACIDGRWKRMREHPERNLSFDELKARIRARAVQ